MSIDLAKMEEEILKPSDRLLEDMAAIQGDILLLGVGGKMGPSLARLAKRAAQMSGNNNRIIGVSRFSESGLQEQLEKDGITTLSADLLNEQDLAALPQAPHVLYLAGYKFGTTGKEPFTWAMNSYLPGRIAEKYKDSNIVAFSTGNVYPFTTLQVGGCSEEVTPAPVGEYGQSCLGRERLFQYFSEKNNTPTLIYRLNYAVDFTYGVLMEIAKSVLGEKPVDLQTGQVNVIWQGDANEIALRCLLHCSSPARLLNVTGPETLSVKWIAEQFGIIFQKEVSFTGTPQQTALLSNASNCHQLFGYPRVGIREMLNITATWLQAGGRTIQKPTHFQVRNGKF